MADEPKPGAAPESQPQPVKVGGTAPNISPPPAELNDDKPKDGAPADGAKSPAGNVQAEPLSDGTVPTVLTPGGGRKPKIESKATISNVYRKADIMTTLLTLAGVSVAAIVVIGGYILFTKSKSNTPSTSTKVTTLDKADLDKLNAFFGGNSAGKAAEVLTISSSTLFKGRVAMGSDLKVVGGIQSDGTTALGNLTVDKTSTLGVTNVRGQLTVAGPFSADSPALFNAGATFKGNFNASGNGTFGGSLAAGSLNVRDLTVSGTLNLAGHLSIAGQAASASPISGVSTGASVEGNDSSGVVTVSVLPTGGQASGAQIVTVNFRAAYPRAPHVVITPMSRGAAMLQPYILVTATGFTIAAATLPANGNATSYSFSYWVVQ